MKQSVEQDVEFVWENGFPLYRIKGIQATICLPFLTKENAEVVYDILKYVYSVGFDKGIDTASKIVSDLRDETREISMTVKELLESLGDCDEIHH